MSEQPTFLTREGQKKLEEELHHLQTVRRQEVAERLHAAMEEGDIDENAEYDDAKNEQAFVEGRILTLEKMLKNAVIIDEKHGPSRRGHAGRHGHDRGRRQFAGRVSRGRRGGGRSDAGQDQQ